MNLTCKCYTTNKWLESSTRVGNIEKPEKNRTQTKRPAVKVTYWWLFPSDMYSKTQRQSTLLELFPLNFLLFKHTFDILDSIQESLGSNLFCKTIHWARFERESFWPQPKKEKDATCACFRATCIHFKNLLSRC